jgi:phosphoribosylglycinamide formyltransferase-1
LTSALAVFASGEGKGFQSIVDHIKLDILKDMDLVLLVYDRPEAGVAKRADAVGIQKGFLSEKGRDEFDKAALNILEEYSVDVIAFAGFLRIVGKDFVENYRWRIMNIHPSLLPSFGGKGMYGRKVHKAVLESGAKITGCTVHFVDYAVDAGPILLQSAVPVKESDFQTFKVNEEAGIDILADRVAAYEHRLYAKALQLYADKRLKIEKTPTGITSHVLVDFTGGWEDEWSNRQQRFIELQKALWLEKKETLQ